MTTTTSIGTTRLLPTSQPILDISTLCQFGTAGTADFVFPTPQSAYQDFSFILPYQLTRLVESQAQSPQQRDSAMATLFDVYIDIVRVGRVVIDLAHLRKSGIPPLFDERVCPILSYLTNDNGVKATSVKDIFPAGHGDFGNHVSVKDKLRAIRWQSQMATTPSTSRIDVMARGVFVDQFLASKEHRSVSINPYTISWPRSSDTPSTVNELTGEIAKVFEYLVAPHAQVIPSVVEKALAAVRVLTGAWLNQAWHNHLYLSRRPFRNWLGRVLVGSAPKMLGRTLGWLYQSNGAEVWRFTHGGERAFFDDDHWGLSELPFCDRYVTYSDGEANAISRRYNDGRIVRPNNKPVLFTGFGSSRHQQLYNQAASAGKPTLVGAKKPRIMFLLSSYIGEAASHVPAISATDVQLADLQVWLVRLLRDRGYEVVIKHHPRHILDARSLLAGMSDGELEGAFDPIQHDADVYMFEYAGSAFFESLASARGVVLIDLGVRPFDKTTKDDLCARCEIVEAREDEAHRFRADPDVVCDAVERAAQVKECPEAFAKQYLFGSDELDIA